MEDEVVEESKSEEEEKSMRMVDFLEDEINHADVPLRKPMKVQPKGGNRPDTAAMNKLAVPPTQTQRAATSRLNKENAVNEKETKRAINLAKRGS